MVTMKTNVLSGVTQGIGIYIYMYMYMCVCVCVCVCVLLSRSVVMRLGGKYWNGKTENIHCRIGSNT